jgi:hypothetical protein
LLHRLWHALLLAMVLLAAAGVALALLGPLLSEGRSRRAVRSRAGLLALAGAAGIVLVVEWLVVHRRSL